VWGEKAVGTLFSPSPGDHEPAARARSACRHRPGPEQGVVLVRSDPDRQRIEVALILSPEDTKGASTPGWQERLLGAICWGNAPASRAWLEQLAPLAPVRC